MLRCATLDGGWRSCKAWQLTSDIQSARCRLQEEMSKWDPYLINVFKTLVALPSYIGNHDVGLEIISLLVMIKPRQEGSLKPITPELLKYKFNVPMTLEEICYFKPNLWVQINEILGMQRKPMG